MKISIVSPVNTDGEVLYDSEVGWSAPELKTRDPESWPQNRNELKNWAISRAKIHFESCWQNAISDWEESPNRVGKSDDIEPEEGMEMIEAGINLHLDQVELCFEQNGGPELKNGGKEKIVLNGLLQMVSLRVGILHTLVLIYQVLQFLGLRHGRFLVHGLLILMLLVFLKQPVILKIGFQGEYDLVYRWNGKIRIVDLKASVGKGDRSGGYIEQLRLYAWLWWETHSRKNEVEGLEIWY